MKLTRLAALSALFLAWSLSLSGVTAAQQETGPGDQAQSVVFSPKIAEANRAKLEPLGVSAPYWKPSASLIKEVETRLPDYLQANRRPGIENLWLHLTNYKVQYIGYTSEESKVVYLNAFCRAGWDLTNRWLTELVTREKGGDCYFQLRYDIEQAGFFDINVNQDG